MKPPKQRKRKAPPLTPAQKRAVLGESAPEPVMRSVALTQPSWDVVAFAMREVARSFRAKAKRAKTQGAKEHLHSMATYHLNVALKFDFGA